MKYKCLLVTKDSDHEASSHVEDDEMLIVESEIGNWCPADEFFSITGEMEFYDVDDGVTKKIEVFTNSDGTKRTVITRG